MPFDDASFDAVACQFVLMFVADRGRALAEMARVCAPGGRVTVSTWCAVEESPGYAVMVDLLGQVLGRWAAEAMLAPFAIGSAEQLHALMAPVLPGVEVSRDEGWARFDSVEAWLHTDVRGWTLADGVSDDDYAALLDAARHPLARFTDGSGRVRFPAPALFATAPAP